MPCETFLTSFFFVRRTRFGAVAIMFPLRSFADARTLGLLLAGDGLPRTLATARVRARALPAYRQPTPVAHAPIAPDVHQPLDRARDLAAQVALDLEILLDLLAKFLDVVVGEVLHPRVRVDAGRLQQTLGRGPSDAEDVGQRDFDPLFARQVDACNACHMLLLPLSLFVLGILADHPRASPPLDDLAFVADLLDARSYFHPFILFVSIRDAALAQVVGRQFHQDPVPWQDPDEVHPDLARHARQHFVSVAQLDSEERVRKRLHHDALHLDRLFLR